jgi:dynein heavy chain 1
VLLAALERTDGTRGAAYVLDPKAITKEQLFGTLDATTREWNDGLFTHLLRRIIDNVRGDEHLKRHWIVFDGDVDPEWVENLNALLDDNKILTLPNGERLALPNNVRIMFEVEHLRFATPATVSRCVVVSRACIVLTSSSLRCGMVWFSAETLDANALFESYLLRLRAEPFDSDERGAHARACQEAADAALGTLGARSTPADASAVADVSSGAGGAVEGVSSTSIAVRGIDAAAVPTTLPGLRVQREVCHVALVRTCVCFY